MAPISDPRFSKARFGEARRAELDESRRTERIEYLKPLVVLPAAVVAGLALAMRAAPGAVLAALAGYLIWLGVAVAVGMAGLVVSARLFLGDAGPAGLAALRIAAALAAAHVVYALFPVPLYGVVFASVAFVGLVVWLFDMDAGEAALLGAVIWALVIVLTVALYVLFAMP